MNLTRTNWPLGWTPNADHVNGDPNGLLRMDNLQQDDAGALVLVRPMNPLFSGGAIETMFNINVNGQEFIYAASIGGASIYRIDGPLFSSGETLFGGSNRACFASCLGQILICAGFAKNKVTNGNEVKSLGLAKPDPPSLSAASQTTMDLGSGWGMVEGTGDFSVDLTSLILTANLGFGGDTTDSASGGYDVLGDTFSLEITPQDPSLFQTVKVSICLDSVTDPINYYYYEFSMQDSAINHGTNVPSNLTLARGLFVRYGSDTTLDWKTVVGVHVSTQGITANISMHFGDCKFVGGAKGVLNGYYQYASQSVYDNGLYQAKSPLSDPSPAILLLNGYTTVTPNLTDNANKSFIFRRSAIVTDNPPNNNLPQSNLDQWYKVAETTGAGIEDNLADVDAIEQDITVNVYLLTVHTQITDDILGIIGIDNGRTIYMTSGAILLSDYLNPDAVDSRFVFKVSGDPTEKNLWIKQISNQLRILATTHDIYEISGSLVEQPDGTCDIQIRAIGEAFPPLGFEATAMDGVVYYIAKDGLRATNGGPSTNLMTAQLSLLFQNQLRHGQFPVNITGGGVNPYGIVAGRGKVYCAVPLNSGERNLYILSTFTQQWRNAITDPISLCLTGTGQVMGGYSGDFNGLVEIESATDGIVVNRPIYLLTVSDCNGQPRNRKDTFTLKVVADTGGVAVNIYVQVDNAGVDPTNFGEGTYTSLGTINHNGMSTTFFPMDSHTLGFRYSFKMSVGYIDTFRLAELTLEYEPRPEQLDYLRIQPDNLGHDCRKRFITYAFIIDTLGNDITFTPIVDGVPQATSIVNTSGKKTYIHYFHSEVIGTDISGILSSSTATNIFEFYAVDLDGSISEQMPAPAEYLVIPANDFGTPSRKRYTSVKFTINTRGVNVDYTPIIDETAYATQTYNTTVKQTVEYFFETDLDVKGIDLAGILDSHSSGPFEFYGVITPQQVEMLPPRLESYYLPTTNFEIASWKRIRTIPVSIDTYGEDVDINFTFDSTIGPVFTCNTQGKRTFFCYFTTDIFCVDVAISIIGTNPFEFYKIEQPYIVETLPAPREYDQIGPFVMQKVGKIFAFRLRLIANTGSINVNIYTEDSDTFTTYGSPTYTTTLTTTVGVDQVYEIDMPKNINPSVVRVTLSADIPFFRMETLIKVAMSGMETDSQWMPI